MRKIVIIDEGPRRNMNTAHMLQRFAEGAKSAGADIEVKTYRLYHNPDGIMLMYADSGHLRSHQNCGSRAFVLSLGGAGGG